MISSSERGARPVLTDLVLSPLGASIADMVDAARAAEESGFDGVWTFDHFSGDMFGSPHSRDPFVALAAIAAATDRVSLGVLVANMVNRHPVALASALNSLQSMAPDRMWCGLGSGATPGSRFAGEQLAIGRQPNDGATRQRQLVETIDAIRAIWSGEDLDGEFVTLDGLAGVVDSDHDVPPIVVGASGESTVRLAARHADGVNIRMSGAFADRVAAVRAELADHRDPATAFDLSVFDALDLDHPTGGAVEPFAELGVDRRTLYVVAPYPIAAIRAIGDRLASDRA